MKVAVTGAAGFVGTNLVNQLVADGHVLVEGVPGLAKTTAVKALAS